MDCPVSPSEDPAKYVVGTTCIANAEELEEHMGAELRSRYQGMEYWALHTALSRRRLPVCMGLRVVRTWLQKYSVSSSSSSVQHVPPAAGEPTVLLDIDGVDELEALCGEKYRRDVSDFGIGLTTREMQGCLRRWGYSVSTEACRKWLLKYRLANIAKQGAVAVYKLHLHDLQYWFHVEKMSPTDLQTKYLEEHGVHAHRDHLVTFLKAPAQALCVLRSNEDVHSHACGEYVLNQFQQGVSPEAVAVSCLSRYLAVVSQERVLAYRRYREQVAGYWSCDNLGWVHWKTLYDLLMAYATRLPVKYVHSNKQWEY